MLKILHVKQTRGSGHRFKATSFLLAFHEGRTGLMSCRQKTLALGNVYLYSLLLCGSCRQTTG